MKELYCMVLKRIELTQDKLATQKLLERQDKDHRTLGRSRTRFQIHGYAYTFPLELDQGRTCQNE